MNTRQLTMIVLHLFFISIGLLWNQYPSNETQSNLQTSSKVAFVNNNNGQSLIYLVDLDGGNLRRLTTRDSQYVGETSPNWSPDGSRIFFLSNWHNGGIYEAEVAGETQGDLITEELPSYPSSIGLSPDGNKIAFTVLTSNTIDLYLLNVDGSDLRELYHTTCNCTGSTIPVWSPDNNYLILESYDDDYQIDLINADGSEVRRLTNDMLGGFLTNWSPNGTQIAFINYQNDNREIFVGDLSSSSTIQLTNNEIDEYQPIWSPDGQQIAFTDGISIYLINTDSSSFTEVVNVYDYIYSEYEHYAGQFSRASATGVKWLQSGSGLIFTFSIYGLTSDSQSDIQSLLSWIDISCVQETDGCSVQHILPITVVEGEIGQFEVSPSIDFSDRP